MRRFSQIRWFIAIFIGFLALPAAATTYYVNAGNTNPVPPYSIWSTAATNIQDAINISPPEALILVTNGIYQYGGVNSSCVYANDSQTIQSVNGPAYTIIEGYQVPGTTNGSSAMRCVYLQKGCSLYGFTLTNGATVIGGGYGGGVYCGAPGCVVSNCIITGNSASSLGAGAYSGTLENCILSGNVLYSGGSGGGADGSVLINCLVTANSAGYRGAAAENSTLVNCTVVTNIGQADGVDDCKLLNCISYYNYPDNGESSGDGTSFSNCCVAVYPAFNSGNNFTNAPLFVNLAGSDFHLSPASPCINAGNNSYITNSTDLDGNPRIVYGIVDLGAYESPYNSLTVHYVSLDSTNPVAPFNDWTIAATNIQNAVDISTNGDWVWVTNGVYATGGRTVNGYALTNRVVINKAVTVQSVNGPGATVIQGNTPAGSTAIRCVYLTNGAALYGFTLTNGATLTSGNGTYEMSGGGLLGESTKAIVSNCVVIGCSAYDGGGTEGGTLNNCAILHNFAAYGGGGVFGYATFSNAGMISNMLKNCVIASNSCEGHGGGVYGSVLNDCLISSNSTGAAYDGGGAAYCTLNNCIITNNSAPDSYGGGVSYSSLTNSLVVRNTARDGGGAYSSTLENCTVAGNFVNVVSGSGGGTYQCTGYNSIIYGNIGPLATANNTSPTMSYCDTTPLAAGFGNITNDPAFVSSGGDFHLLSNSPCINSGNNSYVTTSTDLDGNPRILGGTVDIGAYEYQTPMSVISYAYLEQYGLPTDGSVDYADLDGTGFNVYQDWIAGLNPTNSASVLAMLSPASTNNASGITVTWQSVTNILYNLQRSTNLSAPSPFITIQNNIVGQAGTTSYTDTSATNNLPYFYRVGVP